MKPFTLNIAGQLFHANRPVVMTVLNVTPDSFYSGSRVGDEADLCRRLVEIASAAGDLPQIIDIGGCSTRPGAEQVSESEELRRVLWALAIVRREIGTDIPVSIDTYRASVIERTFDRFGGVIINDISGGTLNPTGPDAMFALAAERSLPYIAGHTRGTPEEMAQNAKYQDITSDIIAYFVEKLSQLRDAGIRDVILDPCFGFAKTPAQNFELLRNYSQLALFELPIVAALSRKSMIYKTLGITPEEALHGTTALHWEALRGGAAILRVHDTTPAAQCVRLFTEFEKH